MSDFTDRLDKAIQRGSRLRQQSETQQAKAELSRDQAKAVHGDMRLKLTERIEANLRALCDRFPGFEYEGVYSVEGWGGAIYRNDIALAKPSPGQRGGSRDLYSRCQLHVAPLGEGDRPILEIVGKGTVRNRELFNRRHFERIEQADGEDFLEKIDLWTIEYAEQYSAG